jgi:hypothetical protein
MVCGGTSQLITRTDVFRETRRRRLPKSYLDWKASHHATSFQRAIWRATARAVQCRVANLYLRQARHVQQVVWGATGVTAKLCLCFLLFGASST